MFGQPDTDNLLRVPLLGNRVDRFRRTGSALVYESNVKRLLAFQNDGAPILLDRATQLSRRVETTTAARLRSGPTASSTSPPVTSVAAGRCRT